MANKRKPRLRENRTERRQAVAELEEAIQRTVNPKPATPAHPPATGIPVGSNNASLITGHRRFIANKVTVDDGRPDEAQLLQSEASTRTTETAPMRAEAGSPAPAGDLILRLGF